MRHTAALCPVFPATSRHILRAPHLPRTRHVRLVRTMSTQTFQDIQVPSPGFGAMSLAGNYGPSDPEEAQKVLKRALDLGCTFWDTAMVYGMGSNEEAIGRFFRENEGSREKVFLASKCGWDVDFEAKTNSGVINTPEHIEASIEGSIKRLGTTPDLYYLHRRDPNVPVEQSFGTLDKLRKEGKTKYIGISECSAQTLREACKVTKVDAIQIEYSPWFTEHEDNDLLQAARDNGVAIIAFSPLGKGMLTGAFRDPKQYANDIRGQAPRFNEHLEANLKLVDEFERLAKAKGCTPGQLSIAWVMKQGAIPIPGTKNVGRLEENWGAGKVEISDEEMKEIRAVIDAAAVKGDRYGQANMALVGK